MAQVPGLNTHIVPDDHRKVNLGDATHEFNSVRAATVTADTVTAAVVGNITGNIVGAIDATTALELPSTAGPTSGALTAAMSGRLCIAVVDAVYTLPAPTAGVWYTIWTGVASVGTGVVVTATSTLIQAKVSNAAAAAAITDATSITNTGATDIVGDQVTIRSDGTRWFVTSQSGTWAGS